MQVIVQTCCFFSLSSCRSATYFYHSSQRRNSLFSFSKVFPEAGIRSRQLLGSDCCQPHTYFITFLLWQGRCRCIKHPNSSAICQPSKPEQSSQQTAVKHTKLIQTAAVDAELRGPMQINAADGERAI